MNSPLLRRQAKKNTLHGRKNEKRVARALGAELTISSGSTDRQKGDFRDEHFLYDAKSTSKFSISVSIKMLKKLEKEAAMVGKNPCLTVAWVNYDGTSDQMRDWALIPMDVFKELLCR